MPADPTRARARQLLITMERGGLCAIEALEKNLKTADYKAPDDSRPSDRNGAGVRQAETHARR